MEVTFSLLLSCGDTENHSRNYLKMLTLRAFVVLGLSWTCRGEIRLQFSADLQSNVSKVQHICPFITLEKEWMNFKRCLYKIKLKVKMWKKIILFPKSSLENVSKFVQTSNIVDA